MSAKMPISNQQRPIYYTLGPHESKTWPVHGSYVSVLTNTSTQALKVKMDDGLSNFIKTGTGYPAVRLTADKSSYEPAIFNKIEFENTTDEIMTFEAVVSLGPVNDTRALIMGSVQVDLSAPIIDTPEPVTVAADVPTILASNAMLKARVIQNHSEFDNLWWGDENVNPTTKRGTKITPGGIAKIDVHGAIYLKSESGGCVASINNIRKIV